MLLLPTYLKKSPVILFYLLRHNPTIDNVFYFKETKYMKYFYIIGQNKVGHNFGHLPILVRLIILFD